MLEVTQTDVSVGWEDAYDSLPEAYQSDSCLEFYVSNGVLFVRPLRTAGLGVWEAYFDHSMLHWCDSETQEPLAQY